MNRPAALICVATLSLTSLPNLGCKPPPTTASNSSGATSAAPKDSAAAPTSASPASQQGTEATEPRAEAEPAEDLRGVEPELTMSSRDLSQEVGADPQAAAAKYGGKVIQLEGEVYLASDREVQYYAARNHEQVQCRFDVPDANLWKNVARKSQATIKGRFQLGKNVLKRTVGELRHSVLVSHGPSPRVAATIEELSMTYRTDPNLFLSKYVEAQLLLEGEVSAIERVGAYDIVIFKTSQEPRIISVIPTIAGQSMASEIAKFPIGKKLHMGGYYNVPETNERKEICLNIDYAALAE